MKSKWFNLILCISMFTTHAGVYEDPSDQTIASQQERASESSSTVGESTDTSFSPLLKECLEAQDELAQIRRKQLTISNKDARLYDLRNEFNKITAKILFLKAIQKLAQEFDNINGEIADYSKQKESLQKNKAELQKLLDEHARTMEPLKTLQDIFENSGDMDRILRSGFDSRGKAQSDDPANHIITNLQKYCRNESTPNRLKESETCANIVNNNDDVTGVKGIIELAYQIAQANANEVSGVTNKHVPVDYDLFKVAINELKEITPLYIKEGDFEKYSQLNQQLKNEVNLNNYEKIDEYVALIQKDLKQSHDSQNKVNPKDVEKIRINLENALAGIEKLERDQLSKPSDIAGSEVDLKNIIDGKNGKFSNLQVHFANYHYFYLENKDGSSNGKSKDDAFKEFTNGLVEDFYKKFACQYDSDTLTSATTLKSCLHKIANGNAAGIQGEITKLESNKAALADKITQLEITPMFQGLDYFSYILTKWLKDNCLRDGKHDKQGLVCTMDGKEYPEVLNENAEYFLNNSELIVSKLMEQGSMSSERTEKSCNDVINGDPNPAKFCDTFPIIKKECHKQCEFETANNLPTRKEEPLPQLPAQEEKVEVAKEPEYQVPVEESQASTVNPPPVPQSSSSSSDNSNDFGLYETGDSSDQRQNSSSSSSSSNDFGMYETGDSSSDRRQRDDGYEEVRYRNDAIRRGRYCGGPKYRRRYNSDRYWRELRRDPYMGNDYWHYERRQGTGSMIMNAVTNTFTPSSTAWNTNPNWMNLYMNYDRNNTMRAQAEARAYWEKNRRAQWEAMMNSRYNGRFNGGYNGGYYPTPAGASPFYWGYNRGTYYQQNMFDPSIPNIGTGF